MKKYLKTISILLAFSICLFSLSMPASAALIGGDGGFYFSLKSNRTATLEEYHGNSSDIAIPSSIYSYAVTSRAENTFSNIVLHCPSSYSMELLASRLAIP